jgi:hypothetical protein
MNNILKYPLIMLPLLICLKAGTFSYTENDTTIDENTISIYNKLSYAGEYNKPDNSNKTAINQYSWVKLNFLNTDFEDDLNNWDKEVLDSNDDSGNIIANNKSEVTDNDTNYIYNIDSNDGYQLTQKLTVDGLFSEYLYKIKIELDYSGYEDEDKSNFYFQSYDEEDSADDNYYYKTESFRGNKDNIWNHFTTMESYNEYQSNYILITIVTDKQDSDTDESPNDTDAYYDNLKFSYIEDRLYTTDDNEIITYKPNPDYFDVRTYAQGGNDTIVPTDIEQYGESGRIYSGTGNDYIVMSYGMDNVIYEDSSAEDNDTIICYQGTELDVATSIYPYSGNDKMYAPSTGTNHVLVGGNGWDTLIFRGSFTDYTFTNVDGEDIDYLQVDGPNGYSAIIYEIESVGFLNTNILDDEDGDTTFDEDLYVFKDNGDDTLSLVNTNLDDTVDYKTTTDYIGIKASRIIDIDIDTDFDTDTDQVKIYIQHLPTIIKSVVDINGDTYDTISKTNEDGEENTSVILYVNDEASISNIKLITEEITDDINIDLSNITITRAID